MINNKEITVIIPLHVYDKDVESLLLNAVNSIPKDINVIISAAASLKGVDYNGKLGKKPFTWIYAESETDHSFQYLVNEGVSHVTTEWFSILEFDDVYTPIWFDMFKAYQEYHQQYNIIYPLVDLYNVEDGKNEFVGNGNEAVWAASFSEEIGVIDEKSVEDYFNFYPTGGMFKTQTWKNLGGLKKNIKLTFWYEFMLRATKENEKVYVVPKVGYVHNLGRNGSLIQDYRNTMDKEESEFWFKTAKKESFYKEERDITYVPKAAANSKD